MSSSVGTGYAFSPYTFIGCSDSCGWQWWHGKSVYVHKVVDYVLGLPPWTCIRMYVQIFFSVLVYLMGMTKSHYLLVISVSLAANQCLSAKSVSRALCFVTSCMLLLQARVDFSIVMTCNACICWTCLWITLVHPVCAS